MADAHGAPWFVSVDEAVDAVDCDAVVVATADHAHYDPVVGALGRGLDVMVEKPLATDLAEARQMAAAAADAGRVLKVNHSQREVEDYRWVHDRIREGAIGTPALVQHVRHDRIDVPTEMIVCIREPENEGWRSRCRPRTHRPDPGGPSRLAPCWPAWLSRVSG